MIKFLIKILLFVIISSPSWSMEFTCKSKQYYDCNPNQCNKLKSKITIIVDLSERMVVRKTVKNNNDFMKIKNVWGRDNNQSLFTLYEDKNSHGFIVINQLEPSGKYYGYTDTLYTVMGGWVSTGECRKN